MLSKLTRKDTRKFRYLKRKKNPIANIFNPDKTHQSWYLDNDYSRHMIGEKCMFQCLTPMQGGTITFGGNQKGTITGAGKISVDPYPPIDNVIFVK